jgi:hypothetical protein
MLKKLHISDPILRFVGFGKRRKVIEPIPFQSTLLCSGGARWWFTFPLMIDGVLCEQRVGKLWLSLARSTLGCRHCLWRGRFSGLVYPILYLI